MKGKRLRYTALLALLVAAVLLFGMLADGVQRSGGQVDVSFGTMETPLGDMNYKLYTPKSATEDSPAPGVLLLHGYQNDSETCSAYAIELARRGAVVLSLDEYGHGYSQPGLLNRGYVNHRVKVNFGEDSAEDGTFVSVGGAKRFRLMMNFSNLSFFDEHYTHDGDGNAITDSSCGGTAAYALLASLPNVDGSRLGISGHSMGTWSGWSVAAAYSDSEIRPKATVLQCGELFRDSAYDSESISFDNVLLLQAKYDEFSYFRDYKNVVDEALLRSELRTEFLGCTADEAAWNETFGSFEDGTARRMELLMTNHRLTTHHKGGLAVAMDWFGTALGIETDLAADDIVAVKKDVFSMLAMFCAIAAMLPLMELLLTLPFFAAAAQPLPPIETVKPRGKWWKATVITVLLSGLTYPFMTQLGHGLLPLPENIFRMTIGNGFLSWYLLLILIMLLTNAIARRGRRKAGLPADRYGMGLGSAEAPEKISGRLFARGALLAVCMLALMYLLVFVCQKLFLLDLRFIWPFFKSFNLTRFGQFWVYIPVFALFFILNNSKIMASQRRRAAYKPGLAGFLGSWWGNALQMVGGILLLVLLEYIPFFAELGPGADLLFGSTFGGPFMSLMIVFVPQVLVFSLICTYVYRRTGSVYTGAITVASMACWVVTGGSSML